MTNENDLIQAFESFEFPDDCAEDLILRADEIREESIVMMEIEENSLEAIYN